MKPLITQLPKPGIYPETPFGRYLRLDCPSRSTLVALAQGESPAQVRWGMLNPEPSTPAQKLGAALHSMVFDSRDEFSRRVLLCPPFNRHKPAERELRQAFYDEHEGQIVLEGTEQWDALYAMGDALHAHPFCRTFLPAISHREVTLIWRPGAVTVKARLDAVLLGEKQILDVKMVRDIRRSYLEREVWQRGYAHQGALYVRAARALGIEVEHYVILWVHNEKVHEVVPARLSETSLAIAWKALREPMRVMARCYAENYWPGHTDTLIDLSLPAWVERRELEQFTLSDYEEEAE